jgi:hypothetical protein
MINPPHLGIAWLDALRVLLPYFVVIVTVGALVTLPFWVRGEDDRLG